ncbi:dTDP-glucose 4,6-dehydratase [Amylibacter sp.]|nr:dTDP-glucose 4,6-dehydratase [Amylibacter sp.]MDC1376452.1 dTDP-glucose 4,6-dehydratase [Amylibacter sp.]
MKLIVTGGAGFIGSAIVRLAIAQGHTVLNLDALTYAACIENISEVLMHPNYSFVKADICDRNHLLNIFDSFEPDAVMHLAAETHVDRSIEQPAEFANTNVIGTINMLEAARHYWTSKGNFSAFRFHHVSTDEVFGSLPNDTNIKFLEETPYDPRSPYSASKASSDHFVNAWFKTYGLPVLITNCSNNYGSFQFPEKLIPLTIINALLDRPLPIYGNGENVRDWLYVDDHVEALLLVLNEGKVGRSYNIGGENERTNLQIVSEICKNLDYLLPKKNGTYSDLIEFVTDRPGHDKRYAIDTTRIKNELGWRPRVELEEGLKMTINWYIENKNWWAPLLNQKNVGKRQGLID